ncbi:hypothetical protein GCM10011418_22020 [Sphingobacterium alkalisoli]|uniref:hypothetical protein n=1 Tax=Sphingobacterium alkalisoli TaxID=1874115 RepID=UPI001995A1E7|nr:hypothetical protein [Sphingobacterium alkalisoli]GGH18403.1 hypothetical protein GCM10011418_22020 [Sphingobacterium alkalisoli]
MLYIRDTKPKKSKMCTPAQHRPSTSIRLPYRTKNWGGEFPFFNLPEGLALLNKKPIERKFDRIFFPIDGIMTPIEGRVWKAGISIEERKHGEWSLDHHHAEIRRNQIAT